MAGLANNPQTTDKSQMKKFVVQLHGENIRFVESLTAEQKNNLINRLLHNYRFQANKDKAVLEKISFWKRTAITVLIAIIGVPLFIILVNFSFDITTKSYSQMEKNFQKVFKDQRLK